MAYRVALGTGFRVKELFPFPRSASGNSRSPLNPVSMIAGQSCPSTLSVIIGLLPGCDVPSCPNASDHRAAGIDLPSETA